MALPQECGYTYEDMLSWDGDTRYELYDGRPVALASPSRRHQEIISELNGQFRNYLLGKSCKVYPAPLDVRLFERKGDRPGDTGTVVQPDLMVVCDPEKLDKHGVRGAPDLVIEVLSPTSAVYDRLLKFNLYRQAGVREYWIVDPDERIVTVFTLQNGQYFACVYGPGDQIPVGVLESCSIDLATVFSEEE